MKIELFEKIEKLGAMLALLSNKDPSTGNRSPREVVSQQTIARRQSHPRIAIALDHCCVAYLLKEVPTIVGLGDGSAHVTLSVGLDT